MRNRIHRHSVCSLVFLCLLPACQSESPRGPGLHLTWEKNKLRIWGDDIPGESVEIWYLEAYCRSRSTHQDWHKTTIPHRTEKLSASADGKSIRLRCHVEGGVEVDHEITAGNDDVDFKVEAVNRGPEYVDAVWVQPCIRIGKFTGRGQNSYVPRCFIFKDGKRVFLDQIPREEEAIYKGGQVYVPANIDREDVNPRPLSKIVPSNGLIGCVSTDDKLLFATAWEPYQELFQGIIICIHSDFRLGGLKPGETKRAHGKVYIMENDVNGLLDRYRNDFPEAQSPGGSR